LDDEATMNTMINFTLEGDLAGSGRLGFSLEPRINSRCSTIRLMGIQKVMKAQSGVRPRP